MVDFDFVYIYLLWFGHLESSESSGKHGMEHVRLGQPSLDQDALHSSDFPFHEWAGLARLCRLFAVGDG